MSDDRKAKAYFTAAEKGEIKKTIEIVNFLLQKRQWGDILSL